MSSHEIHDFSIVSHFNHHFPSGSITIFLWFSYGLPAISQYQEGSDLHRSEAELPCPHSPGSLA